MYMYVYGKYSKFLSLNIFYSINTNDIQQTYIVNIQRIRTKFLTLKLSDKKVYFLSRQTEAGLRHPNVC